ncbi:phosphatidylserine decarboxylase [Labilibaculum sp. DW002]|uniref:Phosphatidylserine decarboxylase proenzyme n=1 Tax=Paralabilibaculum antarcticum TaxID=2912572 RepID=A0ABT5VLZ8_9BACT|nr:phosphatidylserine decarboxylase [Labilibaculum sp. DW002]MDE5416456.1 phosphatidylserine decarboxylase [Labilibaculum sp. DW002]
MTSIKYIERISGEIVDELVPGEGILKWLYSSVLGKASLHLLVKRKIVSVVGGWFMNSRLSKPQIDKFIEKNQIDLSLYNISDSNAFKNFNEFFYRKIRMDKRPIADGVVSPADGKAIAFQSIKDIPSFFLKGSQFTVQSFLDNELLSEKYADGSMLIVRLAPADYHRFHFPASGLISESKEIKGRYFSVSPMALRESLEIFCRNLRVYSTLKTEDYGDVLISEVGATMVGSIIQTYTNNSEVKSGDEKGYFAFGGSTVVLFFEKNKMKFSDDLIKNTKGGFETAVQMGESIGNKFIE